ncbi:hypothetical protein [Flavihumibacter sp. CACIAM 22H1]|uniref:hypothetical protein n=1 Tax=Flavihumibacter sp. CACIAM 22H1 TaxID=1812911 RepID=UPI0007A7FF31|nr:hypothetical protein [Flavihumibacter sp. CACIAM 22H1]KYP16541.1 MAG: hypothetical protein A1D16_13235 [Flavihumibacter sp. CACIAM 22H1]
MKYTQATLNKLEQVLEEAGYIVRYERGTFQSGYCILEQKKVVVLNKFLQLEGKINTMMDLIPQLQITVEELTPEARKTYLDVQERSRLAAEGDANSSETEQENS